MSGGSYRPLTMQCETVNTCNNLCVICPYPHETRARTVMPMAMFERVLADYSAMGGGYLSLTPVTGDVLLDRHLLERLALIARYPRITEVGVTTNAVMLDRYSDDVARRIVAGFGKLQISIYGLDEEEYAAMTRRRTYERAVASIRRILSMRTEDVYLSFRLLKPRTQSEISRWVAETLAPPAPVEMLPPMVGGGYGNFGTMDTSSALPFGASWARLSRSHSSSAGRAQCLVPLLALLVSVTGRVSFCACVGALDQVDELTLGTIGEQSLLELYNSPKARALWDWEANGVPRPCGRCTLHIPLDAARRSPSILREPFYTTGA
jgi:MoaA/NifB/PqqE/SkfB family radical SAM enzyme